MSRLLTALLLAVLPCGAVAADAIVVARVELVDALPSAPSVDARLEIIRKRIQDALVYPELARRHGQAGDVRVRFEISSQGRAHGIATTGSSGIWLLDRAAERSVREAAPLPYVWGRLEVPVRFDLDAAR
ncbi:MAG: energy transducer TonB [Myxococcales bacterium]|nr:energy transducer TonB [Myxococcales bacterium]